MKIIVFDVPAESGGALTILTEYYNKALGDKHNTWIFVTGTPRLPDKESVRVLRFPWVKKSWFHRIYFDFFVAPTIVRKYEVDEVLSLQNVIVPFVNVRQVLYLHQPLPFVEKRYRVTDDIKLWVYQNLISKLIYKSMKKADKIIVQTRWMKEACLRRVKVEPKKFYVIQPDMKIMVNRAYMNSQGEKRFFYPASGVSYKNHRLIVAAAQKLKEWGFHNFRIIFTLDGDESKDVKRLYKSVKVNKLPIDFVGVISRGKVYEYYSSSILLFPSFIETYGLPLLEARQHNTPILASNCAFSREILDGYDRVKYFDPFNSGELASLILRWLESEV